MKRSWFYGAITALLSCFIILFLWITNYPKSFFNLVLGKKYQAFILVLDTGKKFILEIENNPHCSPDNFKFDEIIDPWGQPLKYKVNNERYLFIYSIGPNGLDEQGKGDDIPNNGIDLIKKAHAAPGIRP
jgi:hypothetical protein